MLISGSVRHERTRPAVMSSNSAELRKAAIDSRCIRSARSSWPEHQRPRKPGSSSRIGAICRSVLGRKWRRGPANGCATRRWLDIARTQNVRELTACVRARRLTPAAQGTGYLLTACGYRLDQSRTHTHTARALLNPPSQPGGFFFGLCRARRPVDGVAFVPTFFGAFDAIGRVKREAHRCSKRLLR